MAYAGARFALSVLDALFGGKKGIVECSYVDLKADPQGAGKFIKATGIPGNLEFFSVPVELGVSRSSSTSVLLFLFYISRLTVPLCLRIGS